jgi:NAD(P)-dependent dehydrogenase (short-subunit alcohol dehydrogenase family)
VDFEIEGRTAYVVGAEVGVGKACATALAAEGVRIASAPDTSCDIVVAHGEHHPGSSLLGSGSLEELRSAWGSIVDSVDWYHAALPGMVERRWGRFIWIGSALAKSVNGGDDEVDAVVSLGMMGLHKVITGEEAPNNVIANTVLRGGEATDEDVANVVAFLCSQGAGYLSGVTVTVDGGTGSAVF